MAAHHPERPLKLDRKRLLADVIAGVSVAFILIPQSLAYAELAGLPAHYGLYAGSVPLVIGALFASSNYLQTGPVALTALLTFGALSTLAEPFSPEYIGLAALLALFVGVLRLGLGLIKAGGVAYLLSQPVLRGFVLGAAFLIFSSQLPAITGSVGIVGTGVMERAWWVVGHPGAWQPTALGLGAVTIALILGAQRLHALFPGVLIAVIAAAAFSALTGYDGATVGQIEGGLGLVDLGALPWGRLPTLIVGAVVIALVGFAEPASLARHFAELEGEAWDPHREFVGQGAANVAAGLVGSFPVGGSFSRTSISHLAGARSRWAGAFTGLFVIAFLPFAFLLAPLPKAVLGATIIAGVLKLMDARPLLQTLRLSRLEGLLAALTAALTIASAPHLEYGVAAGVLLSLGVQLVRARTLRMRPEFVREVDGDVVRCRPQGALWFGTIDHLQQCFSETLRTQPASTYELVCEDITYIDLSAALALEGMVAQGRSRGVTVQIRCVAPELAAWLTTIRESD